MLRRLRARAMCLIVSFGLAAGTTVASLEELLHAADPHDAGCFTFDVDHDASKHRIGSSQQPNDEGLDHCVACHLARAPRLGVKATAIVERSGEAGVQPPVRSLGFPSSASLASVPGRSPPRLA